MDVFVEGVQVFQFFLVGKLGGVFGYQEIYCVVKILVQEGIFDDCFGVGVEVFGGYEVQGVWGEWGVYSLFLIIRIISFFGLCVLQVSVCWMLVVFDGLEISRVLVGRLFFQFLSCVVLKKVLQILVVLSSMICIGGISDIRCGLLVLGQRISVLVLVMVVWVVVRLVGMLWNIVFFQFLIGWLQVGYLMLRVGSLFMVCWLWFVFGVMSSLLIFLVFSIFHSFCSQLLWEMVQILVWVSLIQVWKCVVFCLVFFIG